LLLFGGKYFPTAIFPWAVDDDDADAVGEKYWYRLVCM